MSIHRDTLDEIDFSDVAEDSERMRLVTTGEMLREDFMEPLGLSADALARTLHVPPTKITVILNGTRSVIADTARRLARSPAISTHLGRVAVRASRRFNIQAASGLAQGIGPSHCRILQRGDGYGYSQQPKIAKTERRSEYRAA